MAIERDLSRLALAAVVEHYPGDLAGLTLRVDRRTGRFDTFVEVSDRGPERVLAVRLALEDEALIRNDVVAVRAAILRGCHTLEAQR